MEAATAAGISERSSEVKELLLALPAVHSRFSEGNVIRLRFWLLLRVGFGILPQ